MGNASIHSFNKYFKVMTGPSNPLTCNKASLKEAYYERLRKRGGVSVLAYVFLVFHTENRKGRGCVKDIFMVLPKQFRSLSFLQLFFLMMQDILK